MKKITLAVFALFAAISFSAFAEDTYLTVDAGKVSLGGNNSQNFSNPNSVRLAIGRLADGSATGLRSYAEFGVLAMSDSNYSDLNGAMSVSQYSLQASAVFVVPIASTGIDGLARVGASFNHAALSGTGAYATAASSYNQTGLIYGLGAQYNISKSVAIDAQYEFLGKFATSAAAAGADETQVSVGLKYNY